MARKKNQHQESHGRETIHDKFVIFAKFVKQKKSSLGWAKYMYVCKLDMWWRKFGVFSLVPKKWEK